MILVAYRHGLRASELTDLSGSERAPRKTGRKLARLHDHIRIFATMFALNRKAIGTFQRPAAAIPGMRCR